MILKRWTRLGLFGAFAASASACGAQPADEAPPAPPAQTVAAPQAAAAPAPLPAPPQTAIHNGEAGEAGEVGEAGEAGESGEGGEGGVDVALAASDPVVFGAALAVTEAHVLAGRDAFLAGETAAGAEMFAHPVSEVLADLAPVFAARGIAAPDDLLIDASAALLAGETPEGLAARVAAITAVLDASAAQGPSDARPAGAVAAAIVADQIERAASQYVLARRSDRLEPYLDGYGFARAAAAIADRRRADIARDRPDAPLALETAMAGLAAAYPTAVRPQSLDADQGALYAAASRARLAVE